MARSARKLSLKKRTKKTQTVINVDACSFCVRVGDQVYPFDPLFDSMSDSDVEVMNTTRPDPPAACSSAMTEENVGSLPGRGKHSIFDFPGELQDPTTRGGGTILSGGGRPSIFDDLGDLKYWTPTVGSILSNLDNDFMGDADEWRFGTGRW